MGCQLLNIGFRGPNADYKTCLLPSLHKGPIRRLPNKQTNSLLFRPSGGLSEVPKLTAFNAAGEWEGIQRTNASLDSSHFYRHVEFLSLLSMSQIWQSV